MTRRFSQAEAQEMRDAIDRVELALTAWNLPAYRQLWEEGRGDLKIQVPVRLSSLRLLGDAYDKLNEIMNRP